MMHKIQAIGRLGRDPYTHTTKKGTTFTTFTLATDGPKETTWFKVKTWGKLAEVCGQYLSKGRLVYVEGTVSVEMWTDKEGNDRAELVITANTVKFLDGSNSHGAGANEDGGGEAEASADEPPEPEPEPEPIPEPAAIGADASAVAEQEGNAVSGFDDFDFDDLPF